MWGFTPREHAELAFMAEREAVMNGEFAEASASHSADASQEEAGVDPALAKAPAHNPSNATKILALRMLQGYEPISEKCMACKVPLMDKGGIVQCVVCTNAASKRGGKADNGDAVGELRTPSTTRRKGRRQKKKRTGRVEEAESRNDHEGVLVTEDGFELLLTPQERESMDESTTDEEEGSVPSSLNSSFVSALHGAMGENDLFHRTLSSGDSADGVLGAGRGADEEEGSASSGGSKRKVMNAMLLAKIDAMAQRQREAQQREEAQGQPSQGQQSGSGQRQRQELPTQKLRLPEPLPREGTEHHSTGASTEVTRVMGNKQKAPSEQASYDKGKAFASQIIQETNSILDDLASVQQPQESPVNGNGEGDKEEAYQKGKSFASQIIQETNSILDDLASVEMEGKSLCGSALSPITEGKALAQDEMAPAQARAASFSSALPPLSPTTPTRRSPTSATPASSAKPNRASLYAPPAPGQRKRMTINSLASDQGLSRDHTQALQSTGGGSGGWLGYAPRQLEHAIPEEDERSDEPGLDKAEAEAKEAGSKEEGRPKEGGRPQEGPDTFFDEIRHKALLSRASHYESKLHSTMKGASILRIDTKAHDGAGVVETRHGVDDVSALESPSHHSSMDFLTTLSPASAGVQSVKATQSTTNEELQQRWKAANNRQLKQRQLEAEMAFAKKGPVTGNARLKRIDSCVPDDEKVELARKCLREEGVARPFDEAVPGSATNRAVRMASSPMGMPLSPSSRATPVTSLSGSSGVVAIPPSRILSPTNRQAKEPSLPSASPRSGKSIGDLAIEPADIQEGGAKIKSVADATTIHEDPTTSTDEPSLASLSSSVKRQTARIVALEADALKKHREAEAAAATAREALKEMVRTRNERREEQTYSEASASQYSRRAEKDTTDNVGGDSASYGDEGDSTTLTSASYLDEDAPRRRGRTLVRGRVRSPRAARRTHRDGYCTPKPEEPMRRRSRPPPLRVDEEDDVSSSIDGSYTESNESASTFSTLDESAEGRHRRSLSASRPRRGRMKENLLLPTLSSPDPVETYGGRRARAGGSSSRHFTPHRSQSASPRHLRHGKRGLAMPFASNATKPNHLLPYSPRGGYARGYAPSSLYDDAIAVGMRSRPMPLSRRTESEPMSARGFHHRSGYDLPPFSSRGYSPSLEARMASLDLGGRMPVATPYPPYGGLSMTPKSRHEQRRFGFDSHPHWPRNGFDHLHYPVTQGFDSLPLAQHEAIQTRLNEERMVQERLRQEAMDQAHAVGYLPSKYPVYDMAEF